MHGDMNFFKISGHIFMFIEACISLISTLISWYLTKKIQTNRILKLVITFITAFLIFSVVITVYYILLRYFVYHFSTSLSMVIGNIFFTTTITHLYISGYTIAYMHFVHSRNLIFDIERLEKEKQILNAHLLKKNLEPHFLFNNLSILSGLVKTKSTDIESFMDSFSDVYRYFLKHHDEEIVSLMQELEFIKNYQILLEKRFGKAYQIEINISDTQGYLLPCSLQLCIENAIKHNKGSEKTPLKIDISRKDDKICVSNQLHPVDFTVSSGLGNEYLQKRYQLITGKQVEFIKTETHFIVEIPLIKT
jgi:LytS/YehU family sensor histidine kinase